MRYEIQGDTLPVIICYLDGGEKMITEKGAMSWMSPNMHMATSTNGGIGKAFGRMFSGESMFQNIYTAQGGPGKSGFLASEAGVNLSVFFQKRFGSGLFGGEGFIMQRLAGEGMVFLEFDGHVVEYDLQPGQQIIVDTGYLAAMEATCSMDIQTVPGVKNMLFGGEGIFNTVITGPGHIWLQTMPISNVPGAIAPFIPSKS